MCLVLKKLKHLLLAWQANCIFEKIFRMNTIQLVNKIELLPLALQREVHLFVEFLLNRHFEGKKTPVEEPELTATEKAELDRRYQEYLDDPESASIIEHLKMRLLKKYGLQAQD